MQLSKRLQTVAHLVHSGGVVADIGCDHGFTIIYLVMNQLASAGIAMDVADGPLMRAKEHIHQYGLDNRIALRKSDGLQQLVEGEADTILISGIGGALMERILREFPHVTQSAKELVLSPQSEIYKVRHALHDLGFVIAQEEMVFDQGKYYTIIRCERGSEHYFTEEEYIYVPDANETSGISGIYAKRACAGAACFGGNAGYTAGEEADSAGTADYLRYFESEITGCIVSDRKAKVLLWGNRLKWK